MRSLFSRTFGCLTLTLAFAVSTAYAQQVVYLDFDTGTSGSIVYTTSMRDQIEALMEGHYAEFDIDVTQVAPGGDYSTIFFNSGGSGGLASQVDFRNTDQTDTAVVNVEGLGLTDEADIISASAIIASHEFGHLLGLRHGDSYGPPGFGLASSGVPGADAYTPDYPGPEAADEFNNHIMASPVSVGSTIADITTPSWFSERSAIKLANNEQGTVQGEGALVFDALNLPNTIIAGDNAGRQLEAESFVAAGEVSAAAEVDVFTFAGSAGDLFTFEAISYLIDYRIGFGNLINPMITVLDAGLSPVDYYGTDASNDREFETRDSIIIDLVLPADGTYTVRVEASSSVPADTGQYELLGYRFAVLDNFLPVAEDDSYDAVEDTVLNVAAPGVLANDSDPDGDPLTAVKDSDPANGALTLNSDGSFMYTPNPNFCGEDSFTYVANDGSADSSVATVTIEVECVNDAPVANDDVYNATEDTVLAVAAPGVLANDVDVDGDDLSVFSNTDVSHGILVLNADGSFTYTPNLNYCGPDSFAYIATDDPPAMPPPLNSNEATVSIDVACVNDPPFVTSVVPSAQTSDYSDYIGTVTITVEDVDDPTTTLVESNEPPASVASLSLAAVGCEDVITESPAEDGSICTFEYQGQVLDPGDNVYDILFTPSDTDGPGTVTGTHTLTITPEHATATLDAGNPVAVEVAEEGGDSGVFELHFSAFETLPDLAGIGTPEHGALNLMVPYMDLIPVGPGGPVTGVCDFMDPLPNPADGYAQVALFECLFVDVPVNTYEVVAWVDGATDKTRYYIGSDDGVLVVYDPSLGFTTGGGWFYWPGTADPDLLTCGDDGYPGDKTNFGYNMKYNKKMTNVQGSLLLQRHTVDENCEGAGKFRVKSNALNGLSIGDAADDTGEYGWAAFSGKSVFSAPGAEAEGNHPFLVYVEDHGDQGGGQEPADEFWIEVKDKVDNVVLEVNGPDSDPAGKDGEDGDDTPIENGNIIVPHQTGKKGGGEPD